MKAMIRLVCVLAACLMAAALTSEAATKKTAAPAAAAAPAKSALRPAISRTPYLGAMVLDAATGKVLAEDHADAKAYPASVLKLMDLLIILEKVEQGQMSLQDMVPVSAKAAKTGGSQVWLEEKETFSVDDLLYALMIQSANDAAVALAEKVGGTTEGFVELMNQKARALGMTSTVFHSVHGLPPDHRIGQEYDVSTPRDFSILCRELLKHPDVLRYTATRQRPFRTGTSKPPVIMNNHDHLLGSLEGCDGFKTGYFREAGYSIAVTASRHGQRVVVVVMGSADRKVRDAKASELMAKGFAMLPTVAVPQPPAVPVQTPKPGMAAPAVPAVPTAPALPAKPASKPKA
jgi:D-alanyl-D-alanine carboxypeptidase (penicillin-binding protein 5/6)